jgi:hypothetical protein
MKNKLTSIIVCTLFVSSVYAQKKDSSFFFRADLSITNNGFAIVPAFTLNKPAAYLDMSMGNKRLSFAPQFRYDLLEGRPWGFAFIYRYKAIIKPKLQLSVGGHLPALNYVTRTVSIGGIDEDLSVVRRFLVAEIFANYKISKNSNVALYFLRGHAFQNHGPQNSHFLALQANFLKNKFVGKTYFNFHPQVFYLLLDGDDGYYFNATTSFGIDKFPLAIASTINKAIKSDIATKSFDWNISLVYTIDKQFGLK